MTTPVRRDETAPSEAVRGPSAEPPAAPHDGLRPDLRSLVPAVAILALLMLWIGADGGYSPETWYPSALVILSLWVVVLAFGQRRLPANRIARGALLTFLALVVLNYLSILWAASPGSAFDAANQLSLYLLTAWIFAVLPWTPRALAMLMGLWSLGITAFCAVTLARASSAAALTHFFVDGRFSLPMDYSNATAALAVMGMWPALILSSRREIRPWLRAPLLASAVFLACFSALPQSRAALLGLILTAPLALLASSGRGRLLTRMCVVGGAMAVCVPRTVSVDNAVTAGADVTPVLRHAAAGMLLCALAALVLGLGLAVVEGRIGRRANPDRRPRLGARAGRTARVLGMAVAAVVIIGGAVALEPKAAEVVRSVIHKGNTDASTSGTRLLSSSPEERFDYARVALHAFSGSPMVGIGAGNFGRVYDAQRRFVKHSRYTHDLPLRVLAETGVVGAALFAGLLVLLILGLIQTARSRDDLARAAAAIALCVSGYFLVHSCLDWVDEFPALAAPALALPLAAVSLREREPAAQTAPARATTGWGPIPPIRIPSPVARVGGRVVVVTAGVVLAVALSTAYLSLRFVDRAFAVARSAPSTAYRDISVANALDPLSPTPLTSEGTIALYKGNLTRARYAFTRSLERDDAWYPRVELALIDAAQGQFTAAHGQIDAAIALDANDPVVDDARSLIVRHRRISPIAFNQRLLQEGAGASTQQPVR